MKTIMKTAISLSSLLLLAGCWDFGWSKKEKEAKSHANNAKKEIVNHNEKPANPGKCSHKGCTHDHSKDAHHKAADQVKTQGLDHEDMDDVETQNFEDEDME